MQLIKACHIQHNFYSLGTKMLAIINQVLGSTRHNLIGGMGWRVPKLFNHKNTLFFFFS